MPKISPKKLIAAALEARNYAVAPYSGFRVGTALWVGDGIVVTGANVESASYGLTCCAERVALFKALTEGHHQIMAIAIVARCPDGPMPCGACRQLLCEYAASAQVWVADTSKPKSIRRFRVLELLPEAFLAWPSTRPQPDHP